MIHRRTDVRAGRLLNQRVRIPGHRCPKQWLDRRPDAVDNGSEIGRFMALRLAQLIQRGLDRPALRMPQDHREPGLEALGGELDAAHLGRRHDVARDANDEEVTEALPKDQLGGNAGVGATEDDGEGLLPRARATGGTGYAFDEATISLAQAGECVLSRDHGCGTFGGTSCLRQAELHFSRQPALAASTVWPGSGRESEPAAAAPR